jgi:TonB family protein
LDNDKIYGLIGTLLFHFVILLILFFTVLRTVVPEEEEGVLVNFGNVNAAAGTFEPQYSGGELPRQTTPTSPQPQPAQESLVTQDIEESVALEEARKKEERRIEEEHRRAEEERQRAENDINNRVAGAFGSGSAQDGSQGDAATGEGNQGNPFGNSDQGANEGVGGYGSFNLNGRSIGAGGLPTPNDKGQDAGRIVIDITVDPKGVVIFAKIGRGTNIDNESMRRSAREAALKAKFNRINGTNNQSGTITYHYIPK